MPYNVGYNEKTVHKKILMKSKLNLTEFKNRLKDNTKIGMPRLKIPMGFFAVFNDNPKYFYGNFDNTSFELTINSNYSTSFYVIKGTFINNKENMMVNYAIKPLGKFRLIWIKYFPIGALIMCNSIFYFQTNAPIQAYISFNIAIVVITIVSRLYLKWQNKKLERKFIKIFEIID